ncbi:lytic polysaccharide monooxygenase auxiliary activity family 9 protein [Streptomyces xantholiticus]|uniref:lytic polysaccharide monooxygenase auxiliary activity family 9 protein n=1 Tax=Streptomyces xantholiticus TaxID=68285 RepID=UPI001677E795|nr:lytic polysaccharide monooxygenase [Streptomyces xantholiticus]GGW35775.1 chitin-binding protein [Streptomyces xantholiticus]
MTARRKVTMVAALGLAPLALAGLSAAPASAHGSMTDPVSRISACFAEGPESPDSAACKALVAAGGTQPLYDWNEVNIADAAGNHEQLIPDGKLCSAGRDKYKGLDLPRADWPSSPMASGNHTFRYKATAPHKGSFELYLTKDGYDPTQPLKWSDLEEKPFASVTNPKLENGTYVFDGIVPNKSGRHLIYSIWQRSDSPEAFYTCSDVVFGKDNGGSAAAPEASAPSEEDIKDGAEKSTVDHGGHGGDDHGGQAAVQDEQPARNAPEAKGAEEPAAVPPAPETSGENLAETGGDSGTTSMAIGGAAALAIGAAALFGLGRRRTSTAGGRHSR